MNRGYNDHVTLKPHADVHKDGHDPNEDHAGAKFLKPEEVVEEDEDVASLEEDKKFIKGEQITCNYRGLDKKFRGKSRIECTGDEFKLGIPTQTRFEYLQEYICL